MDKSRPRKSSGVSYFWVLLLVALIGAGLGKGAEIYATERQREQERELLFVGNQFRQAIRSYYEIQLTNGKHDYPARLEDLLADPRTPDRRRHLRKVYVDPMTGSPDWTLVSVGGRITGVASKSSSVPNKQDGFDEPDAEFKGKAKISDWQFVYRPPGAVPGVPGDRTGTTTVGLPAPVSNVSLSFGQGK